MSIHHPSCLLSWNHPLPVLFPSGSSLCRNSLSRNGIAMFKKCNTLILFLTPKFFNNAENKQRAFCLYL